MSDTITLPSIPETAFTGGVAELLVTAGKYAADSTLSLYVLTSSEIASSTARIARVPLEDLPLDTEAFRNCALDILGRAGLSATVLDEPQRFGTAHFYMKVEVPQRR